MNFMPGFSLRKHKGVDLEKSRELVKDDPNTFGAMMMNGRRHGVRACPRARRRPALQLLKTAPGFDIVSSVFFMLLNDGVKVFGDCAINVAPRRRSWRRSRLCGNRIPRAPHAIDARLPPHRSRRRTRPSSSASSRASPCSSSSALNQGRLIDTRGEATSKAKSLCSEYLCTNQPVSRVLCSRAGSVER